MTDTAAHPSTELSPDELARYSRHLVLGEVGRDGQQRLRDASVLVVGAGGLGSPVAMYLAAAGVGRLGVVDHDRVDLSNLQRQILHGTGDLDRPKLESARARLLDLNPHVQVDTHDLRLAAGNALDVMRGYDLVVDGSDNFPTRYLVNDASVLLGIPNVYGAILRWEGQASVFGVPGGPCYRCLFREPPPQGLVPNCAEAGVLGALPGIVGSIQALEAVKLILGRGHTLSGRLLILDALDMSFREVTLRRNPGCPVCGDAPTQTELIDYDQFCGVPTPVPGVRVEELEARLRVEPGPLLLDVREPTEWAAGNLSDLGARLVPLASLDVALKELPTDRDILVHCQSGVRSERAVRTLREAGYHRAFNVDGGYEAWLRHRRTSGRG